MLAFRQHIFLVENLDHFIQRGLHVRLRIAQQSRQIFQGFSSFNLSSGVGGCRCHPHKLPGSFPVQAFVAVPPGSGSPAYRHLLATKQVGLVGARRATVAEAETTAAAFAEGIIGGAGVSRWLVGMTKRSS